MSKERNYKKDFLRVMYQLAAATDGLNSIQNQMKQDSKWRKRIKRIETNNNVILTKYDDDFKSYDHARKHGYLK